MKTLLEYIKKNSTINYDEPVRIEYKSGKPIGIRINADGQDFVLGLENIGYTDWISANKLVKKKRCSLPTLDQWKVVSDHRDEIDEMLKLAGGDKLDSYKDTPFEAHYWSSTEHDKYGEYYAWMYIGLTGITNYTPKTDNLSVRPVITI